MGAIFLNSAHIVLSKYAKGGGNVMDYFRIIGRKQIIIAVVFVAIIALVFSVALSGAASVTTSGKQKKLPIYSVGRADDDKTISISFDAACAAG